MGGEIGLRCSVTLRRRPGQASEAERRSGTHSHREWFGEDSGLPARTTTAPWGYGSRIGARLRRACPGRHLL
ncbi:hypothetical protein C2U70_11375 [Bradyrhizobium guangdongense]|nr:hypothetical protein C2U70_11375 [Bradyrhizobium guangdongense]